MTQTTEATPTSTPAPNPRKKRLLLLTIFLLLVAAAWWAWWYTTLRGHEHTEDAYVSAHIVQITPQIGGTVTAVRVDDTQKVNVGDILLQLDPIDAQLALQQAEASLAQTVRELRGVYASQNALSETVKVREAEVARSADLLNRRASLAGTGAVGQEEIDQAKEADKVARAALRVAREQLSAASVQTAGVHIAAHPAVQRAASKVEEAALALTRTTLRAPISGVIARRNVQIGQRINAGSPLMTVVPLEEVWVDANFKENQLRAMRIGQRVAIQADLYGSDVAYAGRIVGLSAGTGALFSLLPAQNATGNWIKVVQRVPVRIALDADQLKAHPLRAGLSVSAEVDVRDTAGQAVTSAKPETLPSEHSDEKALLAARERAKQIIHANLGGR